MSQELKIGNATLEHIHYPAAWLFIQNGYSQMFLTEVQRLSSSLIKSNLFSTKEIELKLLCNLSMFDFLNAVLLSPMPLPVTVKATV